MSVYYITIFIIIVLCMAAQRYDIHQKRLDPQGRYVHSQYTTLLYVIAASVLIFVAGMRYAVGTDYFAYYLNYARYAEEFFERLQELNEPGFRFICWIIVKLGGNGAVVIFISAAVTIGLFMTTIYRNTDRLLIAVLLFVFLGCWHGSFNGIRQYLAAAIVFSGIRYIRQRELKKYCLVVLVAFLFHASAILMLFAYFIAHNKINLFNIFLMVVGCFVILSSFDKIMEWTSFILDAEYSETNEYLTRSVNGLRVLVAIMPAVFFLVMYNKRLADKECRFCINCLFLNAIMMFATSNSAYLARMGIYTAPFSAVAIPELIKTLNNRNRKVVTFILLLLYAMFWLYEITKSRALNNFHFIWQA